MVKVHTDGASKGNPGPASCGYVIYDNDDSVMYSESISLGKQTNNFAEYSGIIYALRKLIEFKIKEFKLIADSQLAIKQINGQYKVKHPNIIPLHAEVMRLLKYFTKYEFIHTLRAGNSAADKMANESYKR